MELVTGERIASLNLHGWINPFHIHNPTFHHQQHTLPFSTPTRHLSSRSLHKSLSTHAKKKNSVLQPVPKKNTTTKAEVVEEEEEEELEEAEDAPEGEGGVEDEYVEDFGDEASVDYSEDFEDEDFEDDAEVDDSNLYAGDGGAGGGISLAGTWWDKEALTLAEKVSLSFDGDLKLYAFKTSASSIRLRIEKLSNKYGSCALSDVEAFSSAYRVCLDEAERAGTIPERLYLEVSSPGVERVVRIPEELERFKERPMYVRYTVDSTADASQPVNDGIFYLVSFDMESGHCTWGIADVKANRNKAGKGRPLNKKQREWRLQTPFNSLRLVRLHSDC